MERKQWLQVGRVAAVGAILLGVWIIADAFTSAQRYAASIDRLRGVPLGTTPASVEPMQIVEGVAILLIGAYAVYRTTRSLNRLEDDTADS